jgi:hypothetical protein
MAQSQDESVEYPDMDPDDFARFVEYAYRCDYTEPSWILDLTTTENNNTDRTTNSCEVAPPADAPIESEHFTYDLSVEAEAEEPEEPEEPEPEPEYAYWGLSKAQIKAKKLRIAETAEVTRSLRQSFNEREYLTSHEPKTKMLNDFLPEEHTTRTQDFTPVFLAHARLYTFACMRLIDPLKRLTLHKLHQSLLRFKFYERRVGDVVELARYAYEHGEDRKSDGTIEDLRKLVVEYIACEVSNIGKDEAFASLLQEGGEFVVDFWRIVAKEKLGL